LKFNLKNFPVVYHTKENLEVLNWKEGLEKELREKLVYPTNVKTVAEYDLITEILGEA